MLTELFTKHFLLNRLAFNLMSSVVKPKGSAIEQT